MRTNTDRIVLVILVTAAIGWALPCRGQALDIDIAVPEPGKNAGDHGDAKRKLPTRGENPPSQRRNARSRSEDAPPAVDVQVPPVLTENGGQALTEPPLSLLNSPSPRPWAGAAAGDKSEPSWANPAAIPLRQNEDAGNASKSSKHDPSPASKANPKGLAELRKQAARAEGAKSDATGHTGFLNRFFQGSRRPSGQDSSSVQVARRHRAPPQDHRDAPPSPWNDPR